MHPPMASLRGRHLYSWAASESAYAPRQLLANSPSLSLQLSPKHPLPWAALSMDVFPLKKHRIFYKEAQSKQQSKESWKTILTGTFPPTSPDWGQRTLPTWIISCWSHTPSPYIFTRLTVRVTWISFFQGVFLSQCSWGCHNIFLDCFFSLENLWSKTLH